MAKSSDKSSKASPAGEMPIQAKLRYGQSGDSYEQEADRVADSVVKSKPEDAEKDSSGQAGKNISQFVPPHSEEPATSVQRAKDDKKNEPVSKPVQKKANDKKDDLKQVQKKAKDDKPLQKKDKDDKKLQKKDKDEKKLQKKSNDDQQLQKKLSDNPKAEEPDIEEQLVASKNAGRPMKDDVRISMEKEFGNDFTHVVIHNNALSYELCRKINALAFTYGSHIYFAEGKYDPQSEAGRHLLAHELTHVVQQGNELRSKKVQRATGKQKPADTKGKTDTDDKTTFEDPKLGKVTKKTSVPEFELDHVDVPKFKEGFSIPNNTIPKKTPRDNTQIKVWEEKLKMTTAETKLKKKYEDASKKNPALKMINGKKIFFLKTAKGEEEKGLLKGIIMGTMEDVIQRIKRPAWDNTGQYKLYDVDHQLELQLGGQNVISNIWLLEAHENRSSGSLINTKLITSLNKLSSAAAKKLGKLPDGEEIRDKYSVKLTNGPLGTFGPSKDALKKANNSYEQSDIETGAQVDALEFLSEAEIDEKHLIGTATHLAIYISPTGGVRIDVPFDNKNKGKIVEVGKRVGNLTIDHIVYFGPGKTNRVTVTLFKGKDDQVKHSKPYTVELINSDIVQYGGIISRQSVYAQLAANNIELKYLSPIDIKNLVLNENGIEASGKLLPSIELLRKADIDITINSDGIWLSKTFSTDDVKIPGPVKIDVCSFTVMVGPSGIKAMGEIDFSVKKMGAGSLKAESLSNGFKLDGEFSLDKDIFSGTVEAHYTNIAGKEFWNIEGWIIFKKNGIRGIREGRIYVNYDSKKKLFTAKGDAKLDAKWVEKGSIEAQIGEDVFMFTGSFVLAKMPGIESGSGTVTVEKSDSGEYQLKAHGKAKSSIKVIDVDLDIEYDKGILTVKVVASFNKGIVSGDIHVTVTNAPPPPEAPNAGGVIGDFRLYGGGLLTARLTPWLKGTIGVTFDEKNQVIFTGKLAVDSSIKVFEKKSIPDKNIVPPISFDIPIFAIPVGPKSIGLKATISGSLVLNAYFGPGTLEGLELGIVYNPDKPEDTTISGGGAFVVKAGAGIYLDVRASIGINALIGGVDGFIDVKGGLQLDAVGLAAFHMDWSPSSGLNIDAKIQGTIAPKLVFVITGGITAWVAFWDKTWDWELGRYEFGSNLVFGMTLPLHYSEGKDFHVSMDDIQFQKPDIDPWTLLKGIITDIKDKRK